MKKWYNKTLPELFGTNPKIALYLTWFVAFTFGFLWKELWEIANKFIK